MWHLVQFALKTFRPAATSVFDESSMKLDDEAPESLEGLPPNSGRLELDLASLPLAEHPAITARLATSQTKTAILIDMALTILQKPGGASQARASRAFRRYQDYGPCAWPVLGRSSLQG